MVAACARRANCYLIPVNRLDRVQIRGRTDEDDEFIGGLSLQVFGDYSNDASSHTLAMTRRAGCRTVVAESRGKPQGFAIVEFGSGASASLQAIAVTATARGRGVGRRLLAAAEHLARRGGARELRLATGEANVEAMDLFRKTGFRIVKSAQRYYTRGQDAYIMVKEL
jgi:ribosomal protein S18 acetylase RimI-like enzyme